MEKTYKNNHYEHQQNTISTQLFPYSSMQTSQYHFNDNNLNLQQKKEDMLHELNQQTQYRKIYPKNRQSRAQTNKPNQQKLKILAIILTQQETVEFQQFCKDIYLKSKKYSSSSQGNIEIFSSYNQFKSIQKWIDAEFFILSSEKLAQNIMISQQISENWVVFGSSQKGSKKAILDIPNVVYFTKKIVDLRNKLQNRGFLLKQADINNKVKKKLLAKRIIKPLTINPIQTYMNDSIRSILEQKDKNKNEYKLKNQEIRQELLKQNRINSFPQGQAIELQKYAFPQRQVIQHQKSFRKDNSLININKQQDKFNSQIKGQKRRLIKQKISQLQKDKQMPSIIQILQDQYQFNSIINQNQNNKHIPTIQSPVKPIGPGSNRIIDLSEFQKFLQNGVVIYRKKSPQSIYLRQCDKNIKNIANQVQNFKKQIYKIDPVSPKQKINQQHPISFDPNNATLDQKLNLHELNMHQQKGFKTFDNDQIIQNMNISSQQNEPNQMQQELRSRNNKRTSEQVKQHLHKISSMPSQTQTNNVDKDFQLKSISNRFYGNDISRNYNDKQKYINKNSRINNEYFQTTPLKQNQNRKLNSPILNINKLSPQNTFKSPQKYKSSPSKYRSLTSRNFRPFKKSIQKFLVKSKECLKNNHLQSISKESFFKKQQPEHSTIQSYANYVFQTPKNQKVTQCQSPFKQKIKTINSSKIINNLNQGQYDLTIIQALKSDVNLNDKSSLSNLSSEYSNIKTWKNSTNNFKQDISILYLVDHLYDTGLINSLQQIITLNDSIYKFKNLNQLKNQVKQSNQVYDFIFVFLQQIIEQNQCIEFVKDNPVCYFVQIFPQLYNNQYEVVSNYLRLKALKYLNEAIKQIMKQSKLKKQKSSYQNNSLIQNQQLPRYKIEDQSRKSSKIKTPIQKTSINSPSNNIKINSPSKFQQQKYGSKLFSKQKYDNNLKIYNSPYRR